MSADVTVWRRPVVDAFNGVADEAFQRSLRFGHSTQWVSDPNEVVCQMADAELGRHLERADSGLTAEQMHIAREFLALFDAFCRAMPANPVAKDVIDDPHWAEVRVAAAAPRTSLGWPLGIHPVWSRTAAFHPTRTLRPERRRTTA